MAKTRTLIAVRTEGPAMTGRRKAAVGLLCGCTRANEVVLSSEPTEVDAGHAAALLGADVAAKLAQAGWAVREVGGSTSSAPPASPTSSTSSSGPAAAASSARATSGKED